MAKAKAKAKAKPAVRKAVAKKAAPKKAAPKKVAPKKAAPKKVVAKAPAPKKPKAPKGPYTKGDIVDHLAFNLDVTKKKASDFLGELTGLVSKNAKKDFTIPGLGKFHVVKTKKRNGRNPSTGQAIVIPAKTKVKFRVGKALQDAVYPPKK
jgi:DNA-binding protein HU-beta